MFAEVGEEWMDKFVSLENRIIYGSRPPPQYYKGKKVLSF
jgi:hypothetical protein